jgi:ubiquinone/menaquinone biosynthesis C-methylase UbiE
MLLFGKGRRVQADIENLPFKTDRFDYVLSFSALMNAENPEGAVKEVKRVLKPEGIFIVTYLKSFDFSDTLKRYFKLIDMRSCGEDVCFILKN